MDSLGAREPVELVEDGRDVVTDPTVGERRRVAELRMFSTTHRRRRRRSMTELAASEFNCQV